MIRCTHADHVLTRLADAPQEMELFRGVLTRVDEFNAARLKLTTQMADQSTQVRACT